MRFKRFVLFVAAIVFFCGLLRAGVFAGGTVTIKSVQRLPKKLCILNNYNELIGERYNTKFYPDEDQKDIVFVVKMENAGRQPYELRLFYKTSNDINIKEKSVQVEASSKTKETVRIELSWDELKGQGYPDIWWVEAKSLSGEEVFDAKGVDGFEAVSRRLRLISQSQKE